MCSYIRGCFIGLVLAFPAIAPISCSPPPGAQPLAEPSAGENSCVIVQKGAAVLRLTAASGIKINAAGTPATFADARDAHRFYLWTVANAKTLDDAAARAGEIIKGEFLVFKLTASKDITVAGSPGRQLSGSGKEADDLDPGNAEVILFMKGGRIFAACVHGEGDVRAADHDFMMSVLQTAKAP